MSRMFRHHALYRHAGCSALYARKRGKIGENEIKGDEMARELHQIGRAEGGLKVPEKMFLDGFTKVGELFFVFFFKSSNNSKRPLDSHSRGSGTTKKTPQKQGRKCS